MNNRAERFSSFRRSDGRGEWPGNVLPAGPVGEE